MSSGVNGCMNGGTNRCMSRQSGRAPARIRGHALWYAHILHRLSGVGLALFLPLHFWVLSLALTDVAAATSVSASDSTQKCSGRNSASPTPDRRCRICAYHRAWPRIRAGARPDCLLMHLFVPPFMHPFTPLLISW